jgi:hypothetical protein
LPVVKDNNVIAQCTGVENVAYKREESVRTKKKYTAKKGLTVIFFTPSDIFLSRIHSREVEHIPEEPFRFGARRVRASLPPQEQAVICIFR